MNGVNWTTVTHFEKAEWQKNPDLVFPDLVYLLDEMRNADPTPGVAYVIHVAWDDAGHLADSAHYGEVCYAVDFHMEAHGQVLPLLEQWLWAERFPWRGLGLYPWWKKPGLHVDLAPGGPHPDLGRRWWRDVGAVYKPLDRAVVKLLMGVGTVG